MESGGAEDLEDFERPAATVWTDLWGGGVNLPWNLVASALIGIWLMCTRLALGTEPPMADAEHLLCAQGLGLLPIADSKLQQRALITEACKICPGIPCR